MISIDDFEFDYPVDKEGNSSPYWLTSVLGSLAEERRSTGPKNYKVYNKEARRLKKLYTSELTLDNLLSRTESTLIKLSDLEARCPSHTVEFRINVQELTKSNQRLLRSFLFFFYTKGADNWINFLIEEQLDRILDPQRAESGGKIFKENLIIRQCFLILGKDQGLSFLSEIYSIRNLSVWTETGRKLAASYCIVSIPLVHLKGTVRRRGHRESSSNSKKSKDQSKEVAMSRENRELEETKARILMKQAKLFEERLDRYLQIESKELTSVQKKEIFNSLLESKAKFENQEGPLLEKGEESDEGS